MIILRLFLGSSIRILILYADIKTYIETCYRNKINLTDALILLMEDNPYTVKEILEKNNDEND